MKKRFIPLFMLLLFTISLCRTVEQRRLEQQRIDLMCGHAKTGFSSMLLMYSYAIIEYDDQHQEDFDYLYNEINNRCLYLSEQLNAVADNTDLDVQYPLALEYLFNFCEQIAKAEANDVYADISAFKENYLFFKQAVDPVEIELPNGEIVQRQYPLEELLQRLEEHLDSHPEI